MGPPKWIGKCHPREFHKLTLISIEFYTSRKCSINVHRFGAIWVRIWDDFAYVDSMDHPNELGHLILRNKKKDNGFVRHEDQDSSFKMVGWLTRF